MKTVLLTKAGKGWEQVRVEAKLVVPMLMQGYHIVRHSAIITRN